MTTEEAIFDAAYKIAETKSLKDVTSPEIHRASGIGRPLVFYYFKTIDQLRDAIVARAVKDENVKILRQLLITGHPHMKNIDRALRKRITDSLF